MKLSTIIEAILRDYPATRDKDKELMLKYWERSGLHLTPEQQTTFRKLKSPETVGRARRKIQEQGKYVGYTKDFREKKAEIVRANIPTHNEPSQLFDDASYEIKNRYH